MAEQTTTTAAMDSAAGEIESKIKAALRSRVSYFREQADSLTFVGVRRLLEEDLGFDIYALDPHKKFVKNYLEQENPKKDCPMSLENAIDESENLIDFLLDFNNANA